MNPQNSETTITSSVYIKETLQISYRFGKERKSLQQPLHVRFSEVVIERIKE